MARKATIRLVSPAPEPRPVLNLPVARGNPYQTLIYGAEGAAFRLEPFEKADLAQVPQRLAQGQGLLHLHWDDLVFGHSRDHAANSASASRDLAALEQFKQGGGRILWTVHNRSPHRDMDPETFRSARARVAALADMVHVHTHDAAAHMVQDWGIAPERIRIIPHPSYLGHYEPTETSLARPLPQTEMRAFLFFGAFRANKGLDQLVAAAQAMARRGVAFDLHLCGRASKAHERLFRPIRALEQVTITDEPVPDDLVPAVFAPAQVFVAPFTNLFTSGSVMLAQTFGLPVIGPDTPALREHCAPENHDLLYDPEAPRALLQAMTRMARMPASELEVRRAAALRLAQDRAPGPIAAQMMRLLQDVQDMPTPTLAPTPTQPRLTRLAQVLGLSGPVRILDVGANPMKHDTPYKALLEAGLAHVTGFEPQPEALADLNARKSNHETYFPDVLGDGATHRLNLFQGSGLASLLPIRAATLDHLQGLRRAARPQGSIDLPSRRLDEIDGIGRVDLFKIDVQGAEAMIFTHGQSALSQALAVQTEVSFFPLYENQPSFGEIDRILRAAGLVPHSFLHIEKRRIRSRWSGPLTDAPQQMLDGDVLYLRDLSQPDALDNDALRRLALLCDTCWDLGDVTLRCLDLLVQRGAVEETLAGAFASSIAGG